MSLSKLILLQLFVVIFTRNYPLFKQCDSRWGNQQLGTSPTNTICRAGCLLSSSAMALSGIGKNFNPSTLNTFLKQNGGYVQDDLYVWAAVNSLGMEFGGFIGNNKIKANLDAGKIVILNVHNGGHWVLAYDYNGDNILVNDPGYSTTSYSLGEIVDGNTGIYTIKNGQNKLKKLRQY